MLGPNEVIYKDKPICPWCESIRVVPTGFPYREHTQLFETFCCLECGTWFKLVYDLVEVQLDNE